MLQSTLLISTTPSPSTGTGAPPPPGLTRYNLHPPTQTHAFKKTSIPANSLAVSGGHVFAAQEGSALVHVFEREGLTLEGSVPFSENVSAVAGSRDGGVVVLGNEKGQVLVWEVSTGAFYRTPSYHHQPITHLLFTPDSNFLLSASSDSSIHIWTVLSLLTVSSQPSNPLKTITTHTRPITCISTSHPSIGPTAFLVSAAEDGQVVLTSLQSYRTMRVLLFDEPASALVLDPLDRAIYIGFPSGDIVFVDLLSIPSETPAATPLFISRDTKFARWFSVPTAPKEVKEKITGPTAKKKETPVEDRTITALAVSYDGTRVYSGDKRGEVSEWDSALGICKRTFATLRSPITGLWLDTEILTGAGVRGRNKTGVVVPNVGKPSFHKPREGPLSSILSVEFVGDLNPLPTPLSTKQLLDEDLAEVLTWSAKGPITTAVGNGGGVGIDSGKVAELEEELEKWKRYARREKEAREKVWKGYVELAIEKGGEGVRRVVEGGSGGDVEMGER